VTDYRVHACNAAAMWEALSKGYGALLVGTEEVRIVAPSPYHALRAIVLDPDANREKTVAAIVDTVLGESGLTRRVVEDASGRLDLNRHGMVPHFRMTVMARPPAPCPPGLAATGRSTSGMHVAMATTAEHLMAAERILISIFPPAPTGEDPRGRIQPARVLGIDGWRVWLGYRDGVPAGAVYSYHDGASVGVYQVGTLPEHRGYGVARALVSAIVRAYPENPVTLTATDQGRPLYEALGFHPVSGAVWWRPNHTGDDRGEGLR
jgi:GNAT superfamily N-acetyltransferase